MDVRRSQALVAAMIGLAWALAPGSSQAESITPELQSEVRQICAEHGGRFEEYWRYNDQGMQWGHVMSCSTGTGFVTCQDRACRSGHWVQPDGGTADNEAGGNDATAQFPTDPATIARALVALAEQ